MTDQGGEPQDGVDQDLPLEEGQSESFASQEQTPTAQEQASPVDQQQTPAGWYPDGTGNQRWWDGQQWADHVAPMAPATSSTDPKTIATLMHVSGIFFGFIGPLVAYLVYPEDPFIRQHSRSALNFQLTLLIGYVVSIVLAIILIGFLLMLILLVVTVVFHIMGAVEANKGNSYTYPMSIEFLKN